MPDAPAATPRAHAVSITVLATTRAIFKGVSFLNLSRLAADDPFSMSIRPTNRTRTRTAKTPRWTATPGIEPRTPAPDLN